MTEPPNERCAEYARPETPQPGEAPSVGAPAAVSAAEFCYK
jgi:hypothetical protein